MIPFNADETEVKHGLKQVGKKFVFSINGVDPEDAGMYQVEVNGVKIFSTDLKSKGPLLERSILASTFTSQRMLNATNRDCFPPLPGSAQRGLPGEDTGGHGAGERGRRV